MKFAETMVLLIISLLAMLLVVRPTLKRLLGAPATTNQSQLVPQLAAPQSDGTAGHAALTDASVAALPPPGADLIDENEMIDIQNIEGRVSASSVRKIGQIVDRHPTETANIIRTWMIEQT
jgi:flagellar M-ring protein FliF